MTLSDTCVRYRERERQSLKPFLMLSLIGSAVLHGGLLVFAVSQWHQAEQASLTDLTPVDLLLQESASQPSPTTSSDPSDPGDLAPAVVSPSTVGQSPGWAPIAASLQPADLPPAIVQFPPKQAATVSSPASLVQLSGLQDQSPHLFQNEPLTVAPSTPENLSTSSPLLPDVADLQPQVVAPSPLTSNAQVESAPTPPALTALPRLQPSTIEKPELSTGQPVASQPSPFTTTLRQWFTPLTGGVMPPQSGDRARSATRTPRPGRSSGGGAAALSGLVARNLSQGWPQMAGSSATNAASQTTCISCSKPSYPMAAQLQRRQGAVKIGLDYDDQGNVTAVRLLQSSGYDDLDQAAIAEAKRWKLKPGKGSRPFVAAIDFQAPGSQPADSRETDRRSDPAKVATPSSAAAISSKNAVRSETSSPSRLADESPRVSDLETTPAGANALKQTAEDTPVIQPNTEAGAPALESAAPPEPPLPGEVPLQSTAEPTVSNLAAPASPAIPSSEEQAPAPVSPSGDR